MTFIPDPALRHPDFLRDESRRSGTAEAIAFPGDADELAAALCEAAARGLDVTIQGARTGIVAGAVPDGGVIVSLTRMDRILGVRLEADGTPIVRVQPGVTLTALRAWLAAPVEPPAGAAGWTDEARAALSALRGRRWTFTPDPTETTASLGGMAACNASGACSFLHGPTRDWVASAGVVLADGDRLELRRGGARARGRRFEVHTQGGRLLRGELPAYRMPAGKHAAGYWVREDMDLLDLVIGSEGTLGVLAELELRLNRRPAAVWGINAFLADEAAALALVVRLRERAGPRRDGLGAPLAAIEYFDADALRLLRETAACAHAGLPAPEGDGACALYVELAGDDEAAIERAATAVSGELASAGATGTWAAAAAPDLERLKTFRHLLPEQVNQRIAERRRLHPGLTKVGTDLAVPDDRLFDVVSLYRRDLAAAGLESVVFGHIGNNHLHVNIVPRDLREYAAARAMYLGWARQVVDWGGTVSAEHGIGKLKTGLLEALYGRGGIEQMRRLKAVFDPAGRLNRGTLFESPAGT